MNSTEKPTTDTRDAADRLKAQVCTLLLWDEMQYAQFQYQTGIAYLMWYLPCDEDSRQQLERSKLYWNWFKNQWNNDDFVYNTTSGIGLMTLKQRRMIYHELHCPRVLAVEVKPNNVVLSSIKKPQHV